MSDQVIALYKVKSSLPLETAAKRICEEQGVGTWTAVSTLTGDIEKKYGLKVINLDEKKNLIEIGFPFEDFSLDIGGIPQLLSIVAGNLFGLKSLDGVRLEDLQFPKNFIDDFHGPKFGMEGVRKIVGTLKNRRPHVGTIVKPKIGLNPLQTAHVSYEAAIGGVDLIKDDETLVNQSFCPIAERLPLVMDKLDLVKEETGRTVLYAVNISSRADKILEVADDVIEMGANMIMIDVLTAGFSALRALAEDPSVNVPIHVHRTMHGAITRNPDHGINMNVIADLVRLCGGDQLHIGTVVGKMEGGEEEVIALEHEIEDDITPPNEIAHTLRQDWHGVKPVFAVSSGGLHPGLVEKLLQILGKDIVIQAGGGIHGHPEGTRKGATAMRQAVDAFMNNVPLVEYSEDHPELKKALDLWGSI